MLPLCFPDTEPHHASRHQSNLQFARRSDPEARERALDSEHELRQLLEPGRANDVGDTVPEGVVWHPAVVDELRRIWSAPDTRRKLLDGLAEKGYSRERLGDMQRAIEADDSDLYDVLAYGAFCTAPITRSVRADNARVSSSAEFSANQRAFVEFVLQQYQDHGVDELESDKLTPLLKLKYGGALNDALRELGRAEEVRRLFVGLQSVLYAAPGNVTNAAPLN